MKDFVCKKCGNTSYIIREKLNGTGKAIGLYCAKCGTWHKWLNKQEKVLYSTHSAEIDKDKEIARLTEENAELKARLERSIELPFSVIDKKTGEVADVCNIALKEEWAKHLIYCDIDSFAIKEAGTLILIDDCNNIAYCPYDRFEIKAEARLAELNGGEQ